VLEAPWIAVASGGTIFVVVLACQTLADGLQAILARRTQGAATIDQPWSAGPAALLRRVLGRRRTARA
jgi:hypothetical protein